MLLHTLRQEVGLVHAIHFWLGKASSPVRLAVLALPCMRRRMRKLPCLLASLLPRQSFLRQIFARQPGWALAVPRRRWLFADGAALNCQRCWQDDASTAAVLATTLQRLLGGAPRRYRELQGAESSLFRLARTRPKPRTEGAVQASPKKTLGRRLA